MGGNTIHIRDLPHVRVRAGELAAWLEAQDEESWWTVDGDPLLTGRVAFPCPAATLAETLRRLKREMLLAVSKRVPLHQVRTVDREELGSLVEHDPDGNRVLQLSWEEGPDFVWLLIEDREIGELAMRSRSQGDE